MLLTVLLTVPLLFASLVAVACFVLVLLMMLVSFGMVMLLPKLFWR